MRIYLAAVLAVFLFASHVAAQSPGFINVTVNGAKMGAGTGSPSGARTGNPGDIWIQKDGGSGSILWTKASGTGTTSGWETVGGAGGAPTDATGITTDVVITKATPAVVFTPGTATDTRWAMGVCDDAGNDDDDVFGIHFGTNPCNSGAPMLSFTKAANTQGFIFRPDPSNPSWNWSIRHAFDSNLEISLNADNNAKFLIGNAGNTADCFQFVMQGTPRWSFGCDTGDLRPSANATYNLGARAEAVRDVVSETLVLIPTNSKPTCSASERGKFWYTQGGMGAADAVEVCAKNSMDAYAWRAITIAGL